MKNGGKIMIFFLGVTYEKSRASLNMIKKESKDFLCATFEKLRATFEKFTCAQLILFMTQTATHTSVSPAIIHLAGVALVCVNRLLSAR